MKNNTLKSYSFVLLAALSLSFLSSACAAVKETLPVTVQPKTAAPSPTTKPTRTPQPTPTVYLSNTPTLKPSVTSSPTPLPPPDDFSKVKLMSFGSLPDWRFMFTFQFPSPVKGEYYVQTRDPEKVYPCRPLTDYQHPERMVCMGYTPAVEKTVEYDVIDDKTGQVLYSGKIAIPFQ